MISYPSADFKSILRFIHTYFPEIDHVYVAFILVPGQQVFDELCVFKNSPQNTVSYPLPSINFVSGYSNLFWYSSNKL